eukprot:m.319275 g.319275  ORF g.319275 m.319275 type:complete len:406 (-) comp19702_c0_seq15:1944-3161(-)
MVRRLPRRGNSEDVSASVVAKEVVFGILMLGGLPVIVPPLLWVSEALPDTSFPVKIVMAAALIGAAASVLRLSLVSTAALVAAVGYVAWASTLPLPLPRLVVDTESVEVWSRRVQLRGQYTRSTQLNGRPVFEKDDGKLFLFQEEADGGSCRWRVGKHVGMQGDLWSILAESAEDCSAVSPTEAKEWQVQVKGRRFDSDYKMRVLAEATERTTTVWPPIWLLALHTIVCTALLHVYRTRPSPPEPVNELSDDDEDGMATKTIQPAPKKKRGHRKIKGDSDAVAETDRQDNAGEQLETADNENQANDNGDDGVQDGSEDSDGVFDGDDDGGDSVQGSDDDDGNDDSDGDGDDNGDNDGDGVRDGSGGNGDASEEDGVDDAWAGDEPEEFVPSGFSFEEMADQPAVL